MITEQALKNEVNAFLANTYGTKDHDKHVKCMEEFLAFMRLRGTMRPRKESEVVSGL